MAVKNFRINGTDYTSLLPAEGYSVRYQKVEGRNAGTMLSGAYTEDVIAVKAVLTVPLLPMTEEQQSALLTSLYSDDYATVYYYDPRKANYRQAVMRYETQDANSRGLTVGRSEYWTGQQLTFEDRFNWE